MLNTQSGDMCDTVCVCVCVCVNSTLVRNSELMKETKSTLIEK